MFKYFISVVIMFTTSLANGQNKIHFEYDKAGNRVQRTYVPGIVKKEDPGTLPATPLANMTAVEGPSEETREKSDTTPQKAGLETKLGEYSVNIYPNPTLGLLSVSVSNAESFEVTVLVKDINGRRVYDSKLSGNIISIDLTREPAGVYLVDLSVGDKKGFYSVVKQ